MFIATKGVDKVTRGTKVKLLLGQVVQVGHLDNLNYD